jgi:hypothetical protein
MMLRTQKLSDLDVGHSQGATCQNMTNNIAQSMYHAFDLSEKLVVLRNVPIDQR